jgi:hypothetical protein
MEKLPRVIMTRGSHLEPQKTKPLTKPRWLLAALKGAAGRATWRMRARSASVRIPPRMEGFATDDDAWTMEFGVSNCMPRGRIINLKSL